MAVAGLYRRILPSPPAIEFASSDGRRLFSEALQNGTMEGFFKLISHFQTQSEPAYCGLASLSMVLNALAIDPRRKWKGPWRWYDESMLDCCEPLEKVKAKGITFGKVACLAHCAGAKVEAFRTNQSDIGNFRNHVIKCASSEDCHLIASYHRKHFKQISRENSWIFPYLLIDKKTGTGHFSPIGGYHAESDMALILDVARFKYPPHWVPLSLLWEAMETVDEATGHPRGFMLISSHQKAPSFLYTLSCRDEGWMSIAKYLIDDVPVLLQSEMAENINQILYLILKSLPECAGNFIKWIAEVRRQEEDGSGVTNEEKERLALKEKVLEQVRETELSKYVAAVILSSTSNCKLREKDSLSAIAANVCCQGAALLSGGLTSRTRVCCKATCLKCFIVNGNEPTTVVSGTVVSGGNEQEVDMLVPESAATLENQCDSTLDNCILMHPTTSDVLTVLLLALPPSTWSDIKNDNLSAEVHHLVSTENLPDALQQEVLHLRRQLHFLKRWKNNEDNILSPAAVV